MKIKIVLLLAGLALVARDALAAPTAPAVPADGGLQPPPTLAAGGGGAWCSHRHRGGGQCDESQSARASYRVHGRLPWRCDARSGR